MNHKRHLGIGERIGSNDKIALIFTVLGIEYNDKFAVSCNC